MRVNHVQKATGSSKRPWPAEGKRCMKCGKSIFKGQPYKWAKGRYSSKRIACGDCSFTRADLTDSIKAGIYSAFEDAGKELDDADENTDFDAIVSAVIDAVNEVAEQYRSTSEEYFSGGGPQAEMADECESVVSDLESIQPPEIDSYDDWEESGKEDNDVLSFEDWKEQQHDEAEAGKVDGEEAVEPEPEEVLKEQYETYVAEELRPLYDEYVQEKISEFRDELEGCDSL